ncbi:hypothetical protein NAT51_19100 [Flavobacterium amniphilum]|uniref:hypothetical protein n=1 Tax=Flavobacterium amniphilum TaxID=1834035 RepID=UPI002029E3F2|nr:hypothetical protein [Flavobacterium amniphilum]MCL9807638.1 hypothetical protein [Flavobacterium amniphilum]
MKTTENKVLRYKSTFLVLLSFLVISCYYPKVKVSKHEKESIVYPAKSKLIFTNTKGETDTVKIYAESHRRFEPNFDFWWGQEVVKSDTRNKRQFGITFVTHPNFETNQKKHATINLSLRLKYIKSENDNGIVVTIDEFRESYTIDQMHNDSLVFKDRVTYNPKTCPENDYCIKKVIYHKKKGIILVEKGSGEIWTLK